MGLTLPSSRELEKLSELRDEAELDVEALHRPDSAVSEPRRRSSSVKKTCTTLLGRLIGYPSSDSIRLRSTSWLDGVRGVAALGVFIFHSMGCWIRLVPAWHADPSVTNLLGFPFVRTIFVSGGPAVSLFFVVSGYVLTHKSLLWLRAGAAPRVYPAVASSMFRRGFRLYGPVILLTFFEMLGTRVGFAPPLNFSFKPEPTFWGQVKDWLLDLDHLMNPVHNFYRSMHGFVTHPRYEAVIWTIPLEFYGSFLCYIWLLSFIHVPSHITRMIFTAFLVVICMCSGAWHYFCFASGMLLADINLAQEKNFDALAVRKTITNKARALWVTIFLLSFYIGGFPTLDKEAYPWVDTRPMVGFEFMRRHTPTGLYMEDHARFWWSLSGVGILGSISQLPRLKAVFETRLCQYLGKVSFSLYLIHEAVIYLFALRFQAFLFQLFGLDPPSLAPHEESLGYWLLCAFVWYPVLLLPVFFAAAQVERLIDAPSVRFARWIEKKCLSCIR
ncbi:hypothetical protein EJ05DRAFT_79684 [Pseudovirgaria hyperparasitica]|uniref:Acyltransferase 3 domain-containing protein n=1 Tax=Pseudovirgaria hyperparasitica TaxID=470096 RepID=A0A6A6W1P0_9PEZI|nr:uncharacterized protein EJ05DRAFT_79684 [Pseudovirgaria hyperparasitica]KAF2755850.1 hypothetical protein EJ05DRAFT_79684 [Pseudovirgaria hyperparasitica]